MAYCASCGEELTAGAVACGRCGWVREPQAVARSRTDGYAIASLVLGIAGLLLCPVVCSVLAIIFGNQARSRVRADPALEGEQLAVAGIVLGWVGVALSILVALMMMVAGMAGFLGFPRVFRLR